MKIYNLILLNFYFLQLFPLLFGMNPGEGPSGSQEPAKHRAFNHLKAQISSLLESVDMSPLQRINLEQQYGDYIKQYELYSTEYDNLGLYLNECRNGLKQNQNNPDYDTDKIQEEIEETERMLRALKHHQNTVLGNMQGFYNYVHITFVEGTTDQSHHGQGQPDQSHRGQGRRAGYRGSGSGI
uniref:Uncharacterized protein n=1 Tax=Meloidogyne javanica TaxID=6303 RepID=A0A915LJV0_MELJA